MASHCPAARRSARKTQEMMAAAGGVSAKSSSDSRGPITWNALNRQRSETKNPSQPDRPKIHHCRAEASTGKASPRVSCP